MPKSGKRDVLPMSSFHSEKDETETSASSRRTKSDQDMHWEPQLTQREAPKATPSGGGAAAKRLHAPSNEPGTMVDRSKTGENLDVGVRARSQRAAFGEARRRALRHSQALWESKLAVGD